MSGIYIPGMEMPTSCAKCKLFGEYGCPFIGAVGYALTRGERNEDCPLVPAPPHGRLGDLDELLKEVNRIYDQYDAGIISEITCMNALAWAIRKAPTIIPADHFRDATKMVAKEDEK